MLDNVECLFSTMHGREVGMEEIEWSGKSKNMIFLCQTFILCNLKIPFYIHFGIGLACTLGIALCHCLILLIG